MEAVLFDLDGTLIDSLADLGGAVNRALADLGYPEHDSTQYREYIGEGARRLVERALPAEVRNEGAVVERALGLYFNHYEQGWRERTTVYPGMRELLVRLNEEGVPVGVISNKPHAFTNLCVAHFFPDIAFGVILGQREGVPRKPAPDAAVEAAKRLGVKVADCGYVGDSGVDMAFAKAAGMVGLGVSWGFRDKEELWESGAEQVFEVAEALETFLFAGF